MKSPYVSELQPNQIIKGSFLVLQKDIRQKRNSDPCLSLQLGDRTGEIEAKMWDNVAPVMGTFERDDFVRVRGLLQVHQNRLQLTVHELQRMEESEVDFTDFFPASKRNPEEMFAELLRTVDEISNPHLRTLLTAVFEDPEIARRYRTAPAAKAIHHAYLGGLLEHTLSVCTLAKWLAPHYGADLDLLLTGVLLHDLGKIWELSYDRSFTYSSDGQLLGHIIISLRMLHEKLQGLPEFPPRLRNLVEHMILSHHGQLEYGSPKVPLFPEALLLHHLDNLDSKMDAMRTSLERDRHLDGCWTTYSASLDRPVLKRSKYMDGEAEPAAPAAARPPAAAAAAPGTSVSSSRPASAPPAKAPSVFAAKLAGALQPKENS